MGQQGNDLRRAAVERHADMRYRPAPQGSMLITVTAARTRCLSHSGNKNRSPRNVRRKPAAGVRQGSVSDPTGDGGTILLISRFWPRMMAGAQPRGASGAVSRIEGRWLNVAYHWAQAGWLARQSYSA